MIQVVGIYNFNEVAILLNQSWCQFLKNIKFEVYKFEVSHGIQLHFTAPSGHEEPKELEVYNFTGAGGVALAMYNTDEVCIWMVLFIIILFEHIFNYSCNNKYVVFGLETVYSSVCRGFNEHCSREKMASLS